MASQFGGYGGSDFADASYAGKATSPTTTVTTNPSFEVDIAFTSNPLDLVPQWVDVTKDVRSIDISRGRSQTPLDKFQAGTCTMVLDNRARLYDPIYTGAGAPYNGNIKPMKRMRVLATQAGVTYSLFDGYIDAWDQQYDMPREARCILKATDGFKLLQNKSLPPSVWEAWILNQNNTTAFNAWYRLDEVTGTTVVNDKSTNGFTGTVVLAPATTQSSSLVVRDPNQSTKFDSAKKGYISLPTGAGPSGNVWTIEAWVRIVGYSSNANVATFFSMGDATNLINIGIRGSANATSPSRVQVNINSNNVKGTSNQANVDRTHVMVVSDGTIVYLYVNGLLEGTLAASSVAPAQQQVRVGSQNTSITGTDYWPGQVDELIIWNAALTSKDANDHWLAGSAPLNLDTCATRINRILDWLGWPNTYRQIDQGQVTLDVSNFGGTVLTYLQKVEETEEGYLFMSADGKVRFIARQNTQNQPIKATFGDSGSELGYTSLTFDYSETLLRNEHRVSRDGGTVQIARDPTGLNTFGPRTFDRTVQLHSLDSDAALHAAYLLNLYKDVVLRVTSMDVEVYSDPTNLAPVVFGSDIGTWFNVRRRPQGVGSAISQNAVVHGIKHHIVPKRMTTTYTLSPIGTNVYWQLGLAGASELGNTTRLGW